MCVCVCVRACGVRVCLCVCVCEREAINCIERSILMVAMETEWPREVQTQISELCVSLCITNAFLSFITSSTKRVKLFI